MNIILHLNYKCMTVHVDNYVLLGIFIDFFQSRKCKISIFLSTDKNGGLHNFQYALKTYLSRKAHSEVTALMYSNSFIHRNIVESGIKYPTPLQFHYFEVFWVIILYIL